MSNGADRFFDEMLATSKTAARKDVAKETAELKRLVGSLRKQLVAAKKVSAAVVKREAACKVAERRLADQERDLKLAEKEVVAIMNRVDKVRNEKVTTRVTTVRSFASGTSCGGWYGGASVASRKLSSLRKKVNGSKKKGTV
jgi:hypothetical protein